MNRTEHQPAVKAANGAALKTGSRLAAEFESGTETFSVDHAEELRHFSHELSNALEVIVQSSYLLSMNSQEEESEQWRSLLDNGVQRAVAINQLMRDYIRKNS